MKRSREVLWYSAGGVIALVVILIAVNFLVSAFNARVDLTEGDVYTLSPGTKAILARLEAPVRIRFYYTQGSNAVPVGLKTFAQRVEDLLAEYRAAAKGKVVIERLNPEPDSDAEDAAARILPDRWPLRHPEMRRGTDQRAGADSLTRTDDLPLTRRLLYQLSYAGEAVHYRAGGKAGKRARSSR